jgi:steroid delta-isomerase-like uncharacterized protein
MTSTSSDRIPDDTARRARREALVRDHMADENALAFDRVLATFPHPHYELVPTGAVHDGVAEVDAYYRESRAAFPDQRNEIVSLRHADDAVIVEFWLRGTHRGWLRGLAPTGQTFECRMTAFFVFDGDRLICERVYFDALTIVRQLLRGVSWRRPGSWLVLARTARRLPRALR